MNFLNWNEFSRYATYFVLIFVLLLTLIFRFWQLELIPSGLNWDEAAYGYNSYSLLLTGNDEWGVSWPIFLRSFGDFKPALLSYLQIPLIYFNGLTTNSLRIPVALLGVISLISWWTIQNKLELFSTKKYSKLMPLIGLLLLATSPWHIHYSRSAMDPIVSFAFLMMGYALFIQKQAALRWFGVASLILSMYTYNSARLFVPILLLLHLIIFELPIIQKYRKNLYRLWQFVVIWLSCLLILAATLFTEVGSRAQSVFILNKPQIQDQTNESIYRSTALGMKGLRFYSNKAITATYEVTKNYISHFDPLFLYFDHNLSARHGFSRHGNLLLITLPFLVWGLFSANVKSKRNLFFLLWLILAPIPSALSDDVPHSGRTLIMLPAIIYFISMGMEKFFLMADSVKLRLHKKLPNYLLPMLVVVGLSLNAGLYFVDLYRYFPEDSYFDWQGDAHTIVELIKEIDTEEDESIVVTNELLESYIFYAFYTQLDPKVLQAQHNAVDLNTYGEVSIDDVDVCTLLKPNTLVITTQDYTLSLPKAVLDENEKLYSETIWPFNRFSQVKPLGYVYRSNLITPKAQAAIEGLCEVD